MRRLLVVDAAGAALTAAITLGALATGLVESGVPALAWWVLGTLALVLCLRGLAAQRRPGSLGPALRSLALANLAYGTAAVGVVLAHRDTVTVIAAAYVMLEAAVLVALAVLEWRGARADD